MLSCGVSPVLNPECLQRFLHEHQVLEVAGFSPQRHTELCTGQRTCRAAPPHSHLDLLQFRRGWGLRFFFINCVPSFVYNIQFCLCVASCSDKKLFFGSLKSGRERGSTCETRTMPVWGTGSCSLSTTRRGGRMCLFGVNFVKKADKWALAQHFVGFGVLLSDPGLSAFIQNCVHLYPKCPIGKKHYLAVSAFNLSCALVPFKKWLIKCGKHTELWLSLLGYFGL